jgi:chorismate synthase
MSATSANSFGRKFVISLFGESHGPGIGVMISGCPSEIPFDQDLIQNELNRRRPGQNSISSRRIEEDKFEILSGVLNNQTTGAPIVLYIRNTDVKSQDYAKFHKIPRPSQIDYPAQLRFGNNVDLRGSGMFSGRISAGIVMAGALAKIILSKSDIQVAAYVSQIGSVRDLKEYDIKTIRSKVEQTPVRAIDPKLAKEMISQIEDARIAQDSVGGMVTLRVENFPAGIGDPWFHSLKSDIAGAMMAIPATRGIEFGTGFNAASMRGSQHNDPYIWVNNKITTRTNHCGGIIGGISLGTPIIFRVPIKPTASIGLLQSTLNIETKQLEDLNIEGRHDPCIVPRIVVVLEAMTAIVLMDQLLWNKGKNC